MSNDTTGYGFSPPQFEQPLTAQNTQAYVYIDLAQVMREYRQAIFQGFCMGRQTAFDEMQFSHQNFGVCEPLLPMFVGIFDQCAYGVYSDRASYETSLKFWHQDTLQQQNFATYEEALEFARNGVAVLNGVNPAQILPMRYDINWRQNIKER